MGAALMSAATLGPGCGRTGLGSDRSHDQIEAGGFHTCAILTDDRVKCWGFNLSGQLGLGDRHARGDTPNEMGDNLPAVDLGTGKTAAAITAGLNHTCALLSDGAIKCWGENRIHGALGLGATDYRGNAPNQMGNNLPAVSLGTGMMAMAVTARWVHTCALLHNGSVKCWGYGYAGELGVGDTDNRGDDPDEMGDNLAAVDLRP